MDIQGEIISINHISDPWETRTVITLGGTRSDLYIGQVLRATLPEVSRKPGFLHRVGSWLIRLGKRLQT